MQTIVIFAVIMFLLGLLVGLPYQQAYKRRLALSESDKQKLAREKNGSVPLDKSMSQG
jgi:hypothetical protein